LGNVALSALADGLGIVLLVSAGIVLLALLAALFLVRDTPAPQPVPGEPVVATAA
jgi:hypothetical protein